MAEESEEGTMGGLKKTLIGIAGTIATAGGVYVTTLLGGGDKEAAPAAAAPVINITQQQAQQATPANKTIIVERPAAGAAQPAPAPKPKPKTAKEELEEAPKW